MIPESGVVYKKGVKYIRHPTHTYRMDLRENEADSPSGARGASGGPVMRADRPRITGYTDGLAAMEQAVFKILRTERYRHVIYNHHYGIELDDLFGKPKPFVKAELPRRISEALLADERITGVDGFIFSDVITADRRTTVNVSFTVHTVYGRFSASREVAF